MKREELNMILRNVALLSQLGLSIVMPMLITVGICYFLTGRFNIGMWIYIPGFVLGIGSSVMTAYKFYKSVISKEQKENKKTRVSFNRHI